MLVYRHADAVFRDHEDFKMPYRLELKRNGRVEARWLRVVLLLIVVMLVAVSSQ